VQENGVWRGVMVDHEKKVVVMRSNPKDSALGKVLIPLSKKYKVGCYIWDRQKDFSPLIENVNITYEKCKIRSGYYNAWTLIKVLFFDIWLFIKLIFCRFDYIHSIDLDTGVVGLMLAKLKNKPFIYQCLDPYYANLPSNWPGIFGKLAMRLENHVITKSDLFIITDYFRMPQHVGANPKSVVEFPNVPVDMPMIPNSGDSDFTVGYIGSLVEGRNLLTIMNTVGELEKEGIRLIIGGFGPLEETIKNKSMEYNNISFIGWIPYKEVLKLENSFHVMIHTTDPENPSQKWVSPNKLFESMALGKPIIVSEGTLSSKRVGMINCGLIVKYGSEMDLRGAILRLKNNKNLAKELGSRGKEEYSREWNWSITEKKLLEAYSRIR
jgi:glycosyltransferase involved in cell wall biosynthesis